MKIIKIGDGYYCCTYEKIVISKLFKDCCIKNKVKKGSFAAQFLNKLLIYLFQYAIDLEEEYKTYYSEYKSFTAYLHEKKLLNSMEIEQLLNAGKNYIYYLQVDLSNSDIKTLLEYDDKELVNINRMLE